MSAFPRTSQVSQTNPPVSVNRVSGSSASAVSRVLGCKPNLESALVRIDCRDVRDIAGIYQAEAALAATKAESSVNMFFHEVLARVDCLNQVDVCVKGARKCLALKDRNPIFPGRLTLKIFCAPTASRPWQPPVCSRSIKNFRVKIVNLPEKFG